MSRLKPLLHILVLFIMLTNSVFVSSVGVAQASSVVKTPAARAISKPSANPWDNFTRITTGFQHTCALTSTGAAYCWGANDRGQLGTGTTTNSSLPIAVTMPAGVTFASITTGEIHTCALSTTGSAYCWGYNYWGQLGDGSKTQRSTPVVVTMPAGVNRLNRRNAQA